MLEVLRTDKGEIKAVCEYYIVDEKGNFEVNGTHIWINELEVAPQYRNNGCIKYFIKTITDKNKQAEYGYFWRQYKYKGKAPRIYHKARWLKLIGGSNVTI